MHSKKSPYKNECTFMNCTRRKDRSMLYNDIMHIVKRYGSIEPYDKLYVLGLVSHKVKEGSISPK